METIRTLKLLIVCQNQVFWRGNQENSLPLPWLFKTINLNMIESIFLVDSCLILHLLILYSICFLLLDMNYKHKLFKSHGLPFIIIFISSFNLIFMCNSVFCFLWILWFIFCSLFVKGIVYIHCIFTQSLVIILIARG